MHHPMMDDTDPLLIRARKAGNWNSIHEPPRLTPPAHLMFDPDTVAENTMRLDELESKMEQALEIQEAWVQQRLADLDRHHKEKIKQIQQRLVHLDGYHEEKIMINLELTHLKKTQYDMSSQVHYLEKLRRNDEQIVSLILRLLGE